MSYNYFQETLVPSTSAWSIGTINRPFKDIWLSYGSVYFSSVNSPGTSSVALDNSNNILTLAQGSAGYQVLNPAGNSIFYVSSAGNIANYVGLASAGGGGSFLIVGSNSRQYQAVTNPGVMMHVTGADNYNNRIIYDAYGSSGSTNVFPQIIGRSARGSAYTPTNVLSGDILFRITANGYNALSGFTNPTGTTISPTTIEAVATESFSGSSVGTEWRFYNSTLGDTSDAKILNLVVNSKGVTVPVASAGITFGDGSFQNTAFNAVSGTWVPQLSAATNGTGFKYNMSSTTGNYYKTGHTVFATFSIVVSSTDTASGQVYLTNLPFPVVNGSGVWGTLSVYRYGNMSTAVSQIQGGNEGTAQDFTLYYQDTGFSAGGVNGLTVAQFTSTSFLYGSMTYISQT
jgi:hypothetical protein